MSSEFKPETQVKRLDLAASGFLGKHLMLSQENLVKNMICGVIIRKIMQNFVNFILISYYLSQNKKIILQNCSKISQLQISLTASWGITGLIWWNCAGEKYLWKWSKKNFGSNRKQPKQDLFRVCFGYFSKPMTHLFRFVSVFQTYIASTETNRFV